MKSGDDNCFWTVRHGEDVGLECNPRTSPVVLLLYGGESYKGPAAAVCLVIGI